MKTSKFKKTQFDDGEQRLLYRHDETFWSFYHQEGAEEPRRVGRMYPSEQMLLNDMYRYGSEWGFEAGKFSAPSIQMMGDRNTPLGWVQYIRIYTCDYRQLSWDEIWQTFVDSYPGKWAIQCFPPEDQVLNEENIYHLFVVDGAMDVAFNIRVR